MATATAAAVVPEVRLSRVGKRPVVIPKGVTVNVSDAPQFTKVDQQMQGGGGRAGVRVFTGTIPDYATDVKGLLLSGVIGGGPAEQAGLAKGDVIIEIAGQTIANIYDYTYALDAVKIGQPVTVVVLRNGERVSVSVTPEARK